MTYSPPPPRIYLIIVLFILFILFQTNKSTESFANTCVGDITLSGNLIASNYNINANNVAITNQLIVKYITFDPTMASTSDIIVRGNLRCNGYSMSAVNAQITNELAVAYITFDSRMESTGDITVRGNLRCSGYSISAVDANFTNLTANTCNCPSDRRLKQNIKELDSVYDSIKKLTPVTYEWKDDSKNDFGLIAQEYYEIFPFTNKSELTGEEPVDETGNPEYYSVDYSKLSVILLQGLKETMNKLEETTNKLNETTNNLNNQILYTNKLENIINERLNKLENI